MATVTIGPTLGVIAGGYGLVDEEPLALGLGVAYADAPGMTPVTTSLLSDDSEGREFRVTVYDPDGNFIAHLPRRRGVQILCEHNTPGSGGLEMDEYDDVLAEHPNLWDDNNLVTVRFGTTDVKTWVMESWAFNSGDDGSRVLTRTGRGNLAILDNAILYPEKQLRHDTSDDRYFNFGSAVGPWYNSGEWKTPKGVKKSESDRAPLPRKWPKTKPQAQWLWSTNPEKTTKQNVNYFRGSFTLSESTRVRFYAAGDDSLLLLLDGEPIIRHAMRRWQTTHSVTKVVPAGTHLVAAMVRNDEGPRTLTPKKSAFLFLVAEVDKKNKVIDVIMRSAPNRFKVRRELQEAPGWFPANVVQSFVTEAQTRDVASMNTVSLGFTDTRDSTNRKWSQRLSQSYKIGTRGLDLLSQLVERGLDIDMTPDGVIRAWVDRGRDLSNWISLDGWTALSGQGVTAGLMNQALVKFRNGWAEFTEETSAALYGRREGPVSAGGAADRTDARKQAQAAFREYAYPETTFSVTTSSMSGPQPFVNYDIYDVVLAPTATGRTPCRVLSIAGTENDDGTVEWTHALYPETP